MSDDFTFGKAVKWGLLAVVGIGVVGVAGSYMMAASSVATAPARVLSRTLETDNIINNYEWFHDFHAQFKARTSQLVEFNSRLTTETDQVERRRLGMELSAVRQTCRDLATRYNANAIKSNRSIFMGREAPESLNMGLCG